MSESTGEDNDERVQAIFLQMQAEFVTTLPGKLTSLEELVSSAIKESCDPSLLKEVNRQLHRLKGTIGSYGFVELSDLIAEIETLVRSLSDQSGALCENTKREIENKFKEANKLIDKH